MKTGIVIKNEYIMKIQNYFVMLQTTGNWPCGMNFEILKETLQKEVASYTY